MSARNRWSVVVLLLCTGLGSAAWAQSDQPSLADVARRKPAAKAKVVVTNDQIPPSPEANNPPASSSGSATAAASKPAPDTSKPNSGKPQVAPENQAKLQQLETDRAQLQQVIKHLEEKIAASDDEHAKTTLSGVLQHAKEALDEDQKQIDKLKAAVPGAAADKPAEKPPATPK
jgi:hypothetical protein